MLCNGLLAVVAEKAAKYEINQCGRILSCRDPVGFRGDVDFDQGLSQSGQVRATKGDPASGVSRFQPGNSYQAGGIGQIPGPGNTGSPLPCSKRARARALLASCESLHSSHLWISPVRGLALACRPSDSRISFNSDCLLASCIPSPLRSDGALEGVTQPVANRFRSGNGCVGQLGKLSGVERTDFLNREFWVRACQRSSVVDKFTFDKVDLHDASPPSSSSSAAVVSGCACGANSEGASGSRGTGAAAGAAGVAGLVETAGFEVFFLASSRAAFAAASISALAEVSVVCSCRCAPVNSTNCCGRSRSSSSAVPVIATGVVRALSSLSDAFCGTTVALIVSPSTREMVSSSLRLRSKGISSVNMFFPPVQILVVRYEERQEC